MNDSLDRSDPSTSRTPPAAREIRGEIWAECMLFALPVLILAAYSAGLEGAALFLILVEFPLLAWSICGPRRTR